MRKASRNKAWYRSMLLFFLHNKKALINEIQFLLHGIRFPGLVLQAAGFDRFFFTYAASAISDSAF